MSASGRINDVVLKAAQALDLRYEGYHPDAARAFGQTLQAQAEAATDKARARQIDKIVDSLGHLIQTKSEGI